MYRISDSPAADLAIVRLSPRHQASSIDALYGPLKPASFLVLVQGQGPPEKAVSLISTSRFLQSLLSGSPLKIADTEGSSLQAICLAAAKLHNICTPPRSIWPIFYLLPSSLSASSSHPPRLFLFFSLPPSISIP